MNHGSSVAALAHPLPRQKRLRQDRTWMLVAGMTLLGAWLFGFFTGHTDVLPQVPEVLPGAVSVVVDNGLFVGLDAAGYPIGYAAAGEGQGYAGPIEVLVGIDTTGTIVGTKILSQKESPGFFRLVTRQSLPEQFVARPVTDPLRLGDDIDAISGATASAEGVALAVRRAVRQIAAEGLDTTVPPEESKIKVGLPEITLLLLFAAGYIGHRLRSGRWKRRLRWGTLITGMVVLGFVYTAPLTVTMVTTLLSGYWPDWHSHLYWYLLMGGIVFVTVVDSKNPYCYWFCPFGAFQECLAAVSGAKHYKPRRLRQTLTWVQRGLAVAAIALGLALRQPGATGFEPFGTLFDLRGSVYEWALLITVVVASLLIYRPFCNYLCPLDPVINFVGSGRSWIEETWRKRWPQRT
jgi:NosR/NirI family transcriptional regulator, nitrous oxide reductase regulator